MDTDALRHYYTEFGTVPDAPTYTPTDEEFRDPLTFIAKIRPIGEKYGIVKIRPPASFCPPFVINLETFKFTPRLQKLTDMEALSRVRINFINKLAKFFTLQGQVLKVPTVDGKMLNLYKLHKLVQARGGYEACNEQNGAWSDISRTMGGKPPQGVLFKSHYKRILLPYDLSLRGDTVEHIHQKVGDPLPNQVPLTRRSGQRSGKTLPPGANTAGRMTGMRTRQTPRELRNLAAKKNEMPVVPNIAEHINTSTDTLSDVLCNLCERGDNEELLLLCDACDKSYHTFCLLPPLSHVPKGDWRCPKCVQEAVIKPTEAFGFEQASRSFTLHAFGEMADRFKRQHFGRPTDKVSVEECEREFWNQLLDDESRLPITVHYGADLLTSDVGSGFPREIDAPHLNACDKAYVKHPWNLNNVSVLRNSVLSHFNQRISGMMTPWIYIGMCFSSFCWHTEDHWSYSINYHHWGQPKVWYGIPSSEADKFEDGIKSIVPELFENQPDLMHHIVTIINPKLMIEEKGIKIFRIVQEPGDFVITFPRGYHAGFNAGFNCAEAVNFCPADWIPFGRASVGHYSSVNRYNVFAHDELMCNMAEAAHNLDIPIAVTVYKDMINMVNSEKAMREHLLAKGISRTKRTLFEKLDDDDRACVVCRMTCYLSALTCPCSHCWLQFLIGLPRFVCLQHVDDLCECCPSSSFTLHYRFTLPELVPMMKMLRNRTKCFDEWAVKVKTANALKDDKRKSLDELRELLDEAKEHNYPLCDTYGQLANSIKQAERCKPLVEQLIANKIRTRHRPQSLVVKSKRLSLAEVHTFVEKLNKLPCKLDHIDTIKEFVAKVETFQQDVQVVLSEVSASANCPSVTMDSHRTLQVHKQLQHLVETAIQLDLHLPELADLKLAADKYSWLVAVDRLMPATTTTDQPLSIAVGGCDDDKERIKSDELPDIDIKPDSDALDVENKASKHNVKNEPGKPKSEPNDKEEDDNEIEEIMQCVHQDRISVLIQEGVSYAGNGVERRLATLESWLDTAHNNTQLVNRLYAEFSTPAKPSLAAAHNVKDQLLPLAHVKQPVVDSFVVNVNRAAQWMQRYTHVTKHGATLSTLQQLESSARVVSFDIDTEKCSLQLTVAKLRALLQRMRSLFAKQPSYHTMAEILMPRHDLYPLLEGQLCQLFERCSARAGDEWARVDEFESNKHMQDALTRMAEQERSLIRRLRNCNAQKSMPTAIADEEGDAQPASSSSSSDTSKCKMCLCQQPQMPASRDHTPDVIRCDLCAELYHADCITWDACLEQYDSSLCMFLCPRCAKGRRPKLDALLDQIDCVQWSGCVALEYHLIMHNIKIVQAWQSRAVAFITAHPNLIQSTPSAPTESESGTPSVMSVDPAIVADLNDVIVDGLLLEVHTAEIDALLPAYRRLNPVEDAKAQILQNLRANAVSSSDSVDITSFDIPDLKASSISASSKRHVSSSTSSSSAGSLKRRRRTDPSTGEPVVFHKDLDPCAADCCLRPIGDSVNWVQCEAGCDQWYHILCVGLTVDAVKNITAYTCYRCTGTPEAPTCSTTPAVRSTTTTTTTTTLQQPQHEQQQQPESLLNNNTDSIGAPLQQQAVPTA